MRYLPSDTSGYIGGGGSGARNILWIIWVAVPIWGINRRVLAAKLERSGVDFGVVLLVNPAIPSLLEWCPMRASLAGQPNAARRVIQQKKTEPLVITVIDH